MDGTPHSENKRILRTCEMPYLTLQPATFPPRAFARRLCMVPCATPSSIRLRGGHILVILLFHGVFPPRGLYYIYACLLDALPLPVYNTLSLPPAPHNPHNPPKKPPHSLKERRKIHRKNTPPHHSGRPCPVPLIREQTRKSKCGVLSFYLIVKVRSFLFLPRWGCWGGGILCASVGTLRSGL